jgi:hypothetical protein
MVPMEDIKNVLISQYQFATKNDNAKDTIKVAGIDSELIASTAGVYKDGTPIQYDVTGALISPDQVDRNTVLNSLQLGGKPSSAYMTNADAADIRFFGTNVSKIYADEVRMLRDELYQLRGELARQGFIKDTVLYAGFQDFFRTSNVKYEKDAVCGILQDSLGTASNTNVNTIFPEAPTEFNVGDFFVIHLTADPANGNKPSDFLVRVTDKNATLGQITFAPSVNDLYKSNVSLYKALGGYTNGSYSFSKVVTNAIMNNKEKFTMLNDDTSTLILSTKSNKAGFATMFKVPNDVAGALSRFSIKARAVGSPGALICYVLNPTAVSSFRTVDAAITSKDIIAQSAAIQASAAKTTTMLDFDFTDANGNLPILAGQQYCFVIEVQYASNVDYWEFTFCKSSSGINTDLESNDTCYIYKESSIASPVLALSSTDIVPETGSPVSNYDLLFILATKEVAAENEEPFTSGLYSTKVSLPAPIEISRARLTMRINREGCYKTTSNTGVYPDLSSVSISPDTDAGTYPLTYGNGMYKDDTIVVGTTVRKVNDSSTFVVKLDKGAFIDKSDPLYKIGFDIYLRCNLVEWDPVTCAFKTKYSGTDTTYPGGQQIKLSLNAVMPDSVKNAPNCSDRLIFEGETVKENNIPVYANQFELQIVWKSGYPFEALNTYKELIGRIFDLTLSFDKSL